MRCGCPDPVPGAPDPADTPDVTLFTSDGADCRLRILFLTDNFVPETNAPAIRTFEHTRVWVEQGHDVTVVTGVPNFPTGRVHRGYRNRPYTVEEIDGIRVVRVWTYVTANVGTLRRSLDYISFLITSIPGALAQERPDIVVGTSPQLLTPLAAWVVARLRRVPFVFELRDLWPESISAVGAVLDELSMRVMAALAGFLYRRADAIVSVTESFVGVLSSRGVSRDKMVVVRNGANPAEFEGGGSDTLTREEIGIGDGDFLVTYVGTIGMAHGLENVLDAAAMTEEEPIHYLLVGEGAEKSRLEAEAGRRGLRNVTFLGSRPRGDIPGILATSDAVVVHLKDDPLFDTVIPSKIFEAMAAGVPIVLAVRGESARIVSGSGAGVVVEPGSPEELVQAIRKLRSDPDLARGMGLSGRRAVEERFSRRALALAMLEVLVSVVRKRCPSPPSGEGRPPSRTDP
jgi:glycosyltransferase involved in cell wall biosynthesis